MQLEDFDAVIKMNANIFAEQNAFIRYLGISVETWHTFELWELDECMKDDLSFVMRDLDADGAIIAFVIGKRHSLLSPEPFKRDPAGWKRLIEADPKLETFYFALREVMVPAILSTKYPHAAWLFRHAARIISGGTKAGYEHKGLARKL